MKFVIILFLVTIVFKIPIVSNTPLKNTCCRRPVRSTPVPCPLCDCGTPVIPSTFPRIVGGKPSSPYAQPWIVGIRDATKNEIFCSGSLINNRYVLTAAHCTQIQKVDYSKATLEFGCYNQSDPSEGTLVIRKIESIIVNEGYVGPPLFGNDIALLKINEPVIYTQAIRTICLPLINHTYTAHPAIVAGWGKTDGTNYFSYNQILREARIEVFSRRYCEKKYAAFSSWGYTLPNSTVCAGDRKGRRDACTGDSGGPLLVTNRLKRKEVIGIVSNGHGCASAAYPGIYTRVYDFIEWILKNTQDACYCSVMTPQYDIRDKIS